MGWDYRAEAGPWIRTGAPLGTELALGLGMRLGLGLGMDYGRSRGWSCG